jgi:glycosyltransferase involved in cell wall biosynthesis/Flp pilus assembly protein TadD
MFLSFSRPAHEGTSLAATDLPSLADRLLAAGDIDGYRALFATLARGQEEVHRRYWATLRLIEIGLAASGAAGQHERPQLLQALADATIEALEREPSEPKLLSCGGVILDQLASLDAARAMFEAARRLDPQLEGIDGRLAALSARRALSGGPRAARRADLAPAQLLSRAQEIVSRAQPAHGLTLSLCMIVRDEQEMLPRCLEAVAGAVDEIVLVDTGSSDDTVEIARSFGARVIEREWSGSFAEARNVSFDAASGDWLMYLDADEVLIAEDTANLRALTGRTWREAFYLTETNYTGALEDGTAVTHNALRIFRNRPEYRFEGRVHEQIAHRLPGYLPERIEATAVRVEHYGYLAAVSDGREKSRRNIELLRLQQEEAPATPFLHFNLGSEYVAAGEVAAALGEFELSWDLVLGSEDRDRYEFTPALLRRLVGALRLSGREADALARAAEGLERFPDFTDLVFEQALALAALGETELAIEHHERCIEMGDAPGYTSRVGCGTYLPRIHLAELRRERGELDQAVALLEQCLSSHPQFSGSVLPYASALLARGAAPDAVLAAVERRLPEITPTARLMLGTALYEAGAGAAAEVQFRAALERQPRSTRARVALAESLLNQRRYDEAATVAAAVATDDPLAPLACRTECFARIAGGDRGGAAALERARSAGMAPEEVELFSAWREVSDGESTQVALAPAVVELLATMLEALLRVQDFDSFETLLTLLGCTPLDGRERRELLAEMYLRRGFAASAAEEWMTVCREEPDARALMGLARVAVARGMTGEADVFAGAALEQEPENEAAASLLARARS